MSKGRAQRVLEPDLEPEIEPEGEDAYYKLFPAEGSADEAWTPVNPAHVLEVRLYRSDGGAQEHLDNYPPAELPDERAVRKLHGGGKYLAIAIDGRKGKIGRVVRRRVFTLRGEPIEPKAPPAPAPPVAPATAEEVPAWLKAALSCAATVLPPVLAYMKDSSNASEQQRQAHQALLVEALKGDRAANVELLKALSTQREAPPPAAAPAGTPAGSPVGQIKEVVECMKALGFKKEEPDDFMEVLKVLAPVFMMGRMGGMPPFPGAPAPALASPPVLN